MDRGEVIYGVEMLRIGGGQGTSVFFERFGCGSRSIGPGVVACYLRDQVRDKAWVGHMGVVWRIDLDYSPAIIASTDH
jgi:hypothetical protein